MPKTNAAGWRGFSRAKETAQGTVQIVDHTLNFAGDPIDRQPDNVHTNADEVTGHRVPTQMAVIRYKTEFDHPQKLMPQNAALFLAQALGSVGTTQPDPVGAPATYEHLITYLNSADGVLLPTRTMHERDGISDKVIPGVACKSVEISGKNGEFVEIKASFVGLGQETPAAIGTLTRPATLAESYLNYGDLTIRKGGSWSNVTHLITGGTDLSAKLRSFAFTFDNGATAQNNFGETSDGSSEIRSSGNLTLGLTADFEIEDEAHKTDLEAGTEFALVIPIVGSLCEGTYYYTVELLFPRVRYSAAPKKTDDGILQVGTKMELLGDPDNAVYVRVINKMAVAL